MSPPATREAGPSRRWVLLLAVGLALIWAALTATGMAYAAFRWLRELLAP